MKFEATDLKDAHLILLDMHSDDRGFFARTYCHNEMSEHGCVSQYVQMNTNYSRKSGTIRGLHWQDGAFAEAKLVRCITGEVFDAIVDMRTDSLTYLQWQGFHLTAAERRLLYVPPGFAHGFLSLTDNAEITYLVSTPYTPAAERGLRWNDPTIGIEWPQDVNFVSEKDSNWPDVIP